MKEYSLPSPDNEPQEPPRRSNSVRTVSILCVAVLLLAGLALRGLMHRSARGGDMTCNITDAFEDIDIQTVSADVEFSVGGTNVCIVEYRGPSRMRCAAQVNGGTLTVEEELAGRFPFSWNLFGKNDTKLTVFLPQRQYDALSVETVSGDIDIPDGSVFRDLKLTAVSGDASLTGAEDCAVVAEAVSGEVELRSSRLRSLSVSTVSGDQTVTGVTVAGKADFAATSGNIAVLASDADSLEIATFSGDVDTELLTDKDYVTSTTSGDISVVPSRSGAGRCEITTVSGDITCR